MIITNGNIEVEVKSGHFVYAEAIAEEEGDMTQPVYTQWGDLKENLKFELEELSKEISEKAESLKEVILYSSGASEDSIY